MNRILCSTGALIGRPNGRDYRLLSECAKHLDCDGYEFMMYDDWYGKTDEIAAYLSDFPKPFLSFHVEKCVGDLISRNAPGDTKTALDRFAENSALAKKLGAKKLVLHLWGGLDSDKDFSHNMAVYRDVRALAENQGLLLTIENVVCNRADPMTHLKELLEVYPDISFTFDTKMAAFHGQLEALYEKKNRPVAARVVHLHCNDFKGATNDWSALKTLHIGEGQVDFKAFFKFMKDIGYQGDVTIESTSFDKGGVIDFARMNGSIRAVRAYLA